MKFNIAQVTGLNTDLNAAQVSFSKQNGDIFLATLQITCDDAFTRGRQLLLELQDVFFDNSLSMGERLEVTFNAAKDKLQEMEEFQLLLGAISGKALYLINKGENSVTLKRGERVSFLTNTSDQLVSGFLQEGDRVLFGTSSLSSFLGDSLPRYLSLPLGEFEDEISAKLGSKEMDYQGVAGLLIKVDSDQEEKIAPIDVIPKEPFNKLPKSNIFSKFKDFGSIFSFNLNGGKVRLILGLVLLLTLIAGGAFQYFKVKNQEKDLQLTQLVKQAEEDLSAAKELQNLNPSESKTRLAAAREGIEKALSINPKYDQALSLKQTLVAEEGGILQHTSQFPEFLDLSLVKEGFSATNLSLSAGDLILLDTGTKTLITIDLATKSHQLLAGEIQLGEAKVASLNGSMTFIYSEDKGLIRVDIGNKKSSDVSKKDSGWGEVVDLAGFGSNIYLLDKSKNQIWKYIPTTTGYSDKREYLTKEVDLSKAKRMQIESSIYILMEGGDIVRFTKGAEDHFSIGGLDKPLNSPKSFFVSSDTEDLYILDSGNSRLLVLSKTGEFKSEYIGDKFSSVSDLVVDEKNKKIYLLEGSKIYMTDLK